MKAKLIGIVGCALLLGAFPASAETAYGWITYVSPNGHQLMLNSQDMYQVACKCLQNAGLNDHVVLVWEQRGTQKTILSIDKLPPR